MPYFIQDASTGDGPSMYLALSDAAPGGVLWVNDIADAAELSTLENVEALAAEYGLTTGPNQPRVVGTSEDGIPIVINTAYVALEQ